MMELHITAPFGRRKLTAAQINAQTNAAACPRESTVHKWTVFRHIATARELLGLSDRSLAVLNALLTFHPDTALVAGDTTGLVVFPSNEQLSLRSHGLAETTLRRHLAALIEAGLLIRRDSPNGKRYARKGQGGEISQAFGFDLTPIVARAQEFEEAARRIDEERRALRVARERVTLLRRSIVKMIEAADDNGGDISDARARYSDLIGRLTRLSRLVELEPLIEELTRLSRAVSKSLTKLIEPNESDGNAGQTERHKQNSKPETQDSEAAFRSGEEGQGRVQVPAAAQPEPSYPLGMVLDACPAIADYARDGIRSWRDLLSAADLVRSMLGISPSAWKEAQDVMSPAVAAATIAAILERSEHIRSPGGYLRTLIERKKSGQYSLGPVLLALNRARLPNPGRAFAS